MDTVKNLLRWFRQQGITLTPKLRIDACPDGSLGVFAADNIAECDLLACIPKKSVMSPRTTGARDIIEAERLGGGLALVFAVMYEVAQGEASPWHTYLRSMRTREYIPLFWSPEELAWLRGSAAADRAAEDARLTEDDYRTCLQPLLGRHQDRLSGDFSLDAFRRAASLVASRAFGVDSFHGQSMVPLADVFNHKAAVVQLHGDLEIEPICFADTLSEDGSEQESSQSDTEDVDEPSASDDEGVGPLTRGAMLEATGENIDALRLEIGICSTTVDGREVLEIVAASPVARGCEVHNTYGELGNAELVSKYGFALRSNPFNAVPLDKARLQQLAGRQLGKAALQQRCRYMETHSDLLSEEAEPFEVLPGATLGPSLLVAARLLAASSSEFAAWSKLALPETVRMALSSMSGPGKRKRESEFSEAASERLATDNAAALESADEDVIDIGNTCIGSAPASVLPLAAGELLIKAIQAQLGEYCRSGIAEDEAELAAAEQSPEERQRAMIAALTLIIGEKEILIHAMEALQARGYE